MVPSGKRCEWSIGNGPKVHHRSISIEIAGERRKYLPAKRVGSKFSIPCACGTYGPRIRCFFLYGEEITFCEVPIATTDPCHAKKHGEYIFHSLSIPLTFDQYGDVAGTDVATTRCKMLHGSIRPRAKMSASARISDVAQPNVAKTVAQCCAEVGFSRRVWLFVEWRRESDGCWTGFPIRNPNNMAGFMLLLDGCG